MKDEMREMTTTKKEAQRVMLRNFGKMEGAHYKDLAGLEVEATNSFNPRKAESFPELSLDVVPTLMEWEDQLRNGRISATADGLPQELARAAPAELERVTYPVMFKSPA